MQILGIKIDNLTKQEILERINGFLNDGNFHQIATINPEFILKAQKDEEFKNILNQCDLNVADGFGIKCAFWRFGKHLKMRVNGADLMREILKIASEKNLKIFLAANNRGLSSWEETAESIRKTYPNLEIDGVNLNKDITGYPAIAGPRQGGGELLIIDCSIVFCNFGAPYQEKFLNSLKNGKIKLVMGVGGSFDFITGKIKRAPAFMRQLGLEWLWRLVQQPGRIKRIFNAVIIFPVRVLFNR